MPAKPLHERLSELVKAAGLTYADIAAHTGWDEQRVYRVLHGKTRILVADVELLAELLEKPIAAVLRGATAKAG